MPTMSPTFLPLRICALLFASLSVTGAAPVSAQGGAVPSMLSRLKLHRIVAPHRTGADLLAKLQTTAAGRQSLSAAGMTSELSLRVLHAAPQTAGDGWPATFDLRIDGSSLYAPQTVGGHSAPIGLTHDGQVVSALDAPPTMLVGLIPAAKSATILSAPQLPAGLYLIAFDFGALTGTGASISTEFAHPPSPPPAACAPATLAQTVDPQTGIGTCIAVVRLSQPDTPWFKLQITSTDPNLAYVDFSGATISRISP